MGFIPRCRFLSPYSRLSPMPETQAMSQPVIILKRTILTGTQDDVLPVPARVLCNFFYNNLKKTRYCLSSRTRSWLTMR
jgi:hypothetical protein